MSVQTGKAQVPRKKKIETLVYILQTSFFCFSFTLHVGLLQEFKFSIFFLWKLSTSQLRRNFAKYGDFLSEKRHQITSLQACRELWRILPAFCEISTARCMICGVCDFPCHILPESEIPVEILPKFMKFKPLILTIFYSRKEWKPRSRLR